MENSTYDTPGWRDRGYLLCKTFSFMRSLLGGWKLGVSRTNPSCKKTQFYPSEEDQGCTWFLKGTQITYFTTFCLNSEIGTVDIHVHVKESRIFFLLLINVYIALSDPTGEVLQICKTVLKTQQCSKQAHVKQQHVKHTAHQPLLQQTHHRKNMQKWIRSLASAKISCSAQFSVTEHKLLLDSVPWKKNKS